MKGLAPLVSGTMKGLLFLVANLQAIQELETLGPKERP